jgi:hypothetical protein
LINIYKYSIGPNNQPSGKVSYYTEDQIFENPIQLVGEAGKGFNYSPVHTLYLYNDSLDVDYTECILFSIDHDTSDGKNDGSWLQYRILNELTGQWSNWLTSLEVDGSTTGFSGFTKKLTYYSEATGSKRDRLPFQIRYSIPLNEPSQLKDDLSVSLRAQAEENPQKDGRP